MSMDTHLPADASQGKSSASSPSPASIPQPSFAEQKRRRGEPLQAGDPVTAADLMDDHIVRRLEARDTMKDAARDLGVHPRTVRRRVDNKKLSYRKYPRRGRKR
jgi:ActR/RegA family two-component response regulator